MNQAPEYRALLAVDIEKSSGRGDPALLAIRNALARAVAESVERSGIAWDACIREDLGDGLRVVAPSGASRAALIHPLTAELGARLQAHNRYAGPLTRIRVRMAVHAGDVLIGADGSPAGASLAVLARMLESKACRDALKDAPETTPLALVVSQHVYEETVVHGYPGVDPDDFEAVDIVEKEYHARGWLHVPGKRFGQAAASDVSDAAQAADDGPTPGDGGALMIVEARGHGTAHGVQRGVMNIHYHGAD